MNWTQCFAMCFTILCGTATIVIPLIMMIRNDMKVMDNKMEENRKEHKEDIKAMDQKWSTLFGLYIEQLRKK